MSIELEAIRSLENAIDHVADDPFIRGRRLRNDPVPADYVDLLVERLKGAVRTARYELAQKRKYNAIFKTRCGCERTMTIDGQWYRGDVFLVSLAQSVRILASVNTDGITTSVRRFECVNFENGVYTFQEDDGR